MIYSHIGRVVLRLAARARSFPPFLLRMYNRVSLKNITKELDFVVQNLYPAPEINNTIKMEVGIEDCLHIEFEYNKSKYHLQDVVLGKIYFLLVRIKIKHMELSIIKRESAGTGSNVYNESETMTKYEIMDGAPVRREVLLRLSCCEERRPSVRGAAQLEGRAGGAAVGGGGG